jgi:hypothetical protein
MPTITFEVTVCEAARIRELARREGLTLSAFLRQRAFADAPAGPRGEYRIATDPLTGLPVMEAPEGVALVSSEQIRALMTHSP